MCIVCLVYGMFTYNRRKFIPMDTIILVTIGVCMMLVVEVNSYGESHCLKEWVEYNNTCYFLRHEPPLNYTQATVNCSSMNATLASIHSANEQEFLTNHTWTDRSYYIGLTDRANEGTFVWSDGTPLDYINWASNQPNAKLITSDCAVLWNDGDGEWNDFGCGAAVACVCQKPNVPPLVYVPTEDLPTSAVTERYLTSKIRLTSQSTNETAGIVEGSKPIIGYLVATAGITAAVCFFIVVVVIVAVVIVLRRRRENQAPVQLAQQYNQPYDYTYNAHITSQSQENTSVTDSNRRNENPDENAVSIYHEIRDQVDESGHCDLGKGEKIHVPIPRDGHKIEQTEQIVRLLNDGQQQGWVDNSIYATSDEVTEN